MTEKKHRRTRDEAFAARIQQIDIRIKATRERLETLNLNRQLVIEGQKLAIERLEASLRGLTE